MLRHIGAALLGLGLFASVSGSAFAASAPHAVGSLFIADQGPGAWLGAALLSDHTATGGGQFAFPVGGGVTEVASIRAVSWSSINSTTLNVCFNVTGQQGPVFPIGVTILDCFPLTITGPAGQPGTVFDENTFYKLTLFGA